MDKNTILDNQDLIQVSNPINTPYLIETQKNNESLLQQLLSNKLYIYIIIGVIILAIGSYYLYIKYFSKNVKQVEKQGEKQGEKQVEKQSEKQVQDYKKHFISSDIEYYLLDNTGNPILINQYINDLNNSYNKSLLINNKIKQERPKLTHPNEEIKENMINNDDNEDNNITNQDLTHEEIEELKKQLELMQMKQNYAITAENDEENEDATF